MDSSEWDARYASTDLIWSAQPNRWVEAEVADLPPGQVLDLAAGEGRNSIWLAALGWRATAVDFSSIALEKGRSIAAKQADGRAERITWHQADVLEYRAEPGGYDLVLLVYLHLPPAERHLVLRHAADALAAGGVLLVLGHDTTNVADGTGGPQDTSVLFTPSDIVADLATSGVTLRIEKAERVLRDVEGADRPAIDALVRATALGES
ncbi:MAG: hypothetical protein QOH56_3156 [Pseudonocardiales bacterium]|nr:hypothetical protein [Pseudonocardiales bacterium]